MKTLIVPAEQEFLDQLGVAPEEQEEPWIRRASFQSANGTLDLSFDQHEKSIRFVWSHEGETTWCFFREAARSLHIRAEKGETHFVVEFDAGELSGTLDVRVFPRIAVRDTLLRH